MELVERTAFLGSLHTRFQNVMEGEGHCVFVAGEAGIGKTSLLSAFCRGIKEDCKIYLGTCDALFTPRPLAPLYDIIWQVRGDIWDIADRSALFTRFFHELENRKDSTVIVIEDIHWADEATLDFIKFFARRITRLRCLFILTYRDNEIHTQHPLRAVLGQLPPDSFTRLQLTPLSRQAVETMALEKGYKGEDVYSISGGNPFYVTEILASYSPGIPENIKDSILSVYNRLDEKTKQVWQILSVLPTGFETKYLEKIEPHYAEAIHNCLELKILLLEQGRIVFKHELYRRTVESSLSPLLRISLNKRILDLFRESFEQNMETERIIHHAKNANEFELVVKYAPVAAKQAAAMGAHIEACRLYLSAIEYYQGNDPDTLLRFYEPYAYECYLTNQVKDAIIYTSKSLRLWRQQNNIEKTGNCLRFLSRLWWFDGNRKKAETYGAEAIEVLGPQPPSKERALAFSNMSQLKMLADEPEECQAWGEKAIAMAREINDEEVICHALNNIGTIKMRLHPTRAKGIEQVQQSLAIARGRSLGEHAARAYCNLGSSAVEMKDYEFAKKIFEEGISYCEERDLGLGSAYLIAYNAKLALETGKWDEAFQMADCVMGDENLLAIVKMVALVIVGTIKMRRGEKDALPLLIEAKEESFRTLEVQRIIPALVALLEYEWLTSSVIIEKDELDYAAAVVGHKSNVYENSEFAFWLSRSRQQKLVLREYYQGYELSTPKLALKAAALWKELGCPYETALALFEAGEAGKKEAISIVHRLGASAICEKMKFDMRACGIKSIPRGIRKSTRSNPANLTGRELDILHLLKEGLQNKEIASRLFISAKTVDHHISAILYKLEVNTRAKAVQEAIHLDILK